MNEPSALLFALATAAVPLVSPIWFAASNSLDANSYAFSLEITEASVFEIPSF